MTTTTALVSRPDPTRWDSHAACATRLDLPWLSDHADVHPWDAATMAAVCAACPVVLDCLAAVDALDVTGGWWAGTDRDPHAHTADTAPTWATPATPTPAAPASVAPAAAARRAVGPAGTVWEPLRSRRGHLVGAQGAMPLLGSAA
ncbi:hypothetical protein [Arsenicicoccus dermatophilus]|uniref:hypothetical protein n=1 Tax=Arsenicicoccus dermatophilus TaxID=1076331 RepID=UPI0039170ED4